MAGLVRLVVIGFIVLTVIHVALSVHSRSVRRRKLAEWWEEEGRPGALDDYIAKGLEAYEHSLRRKLIWGVYIVPVAVVGLIIYLTNFR